MNGDIDLLQVRPLLGSRRGGFEEFCCQLARRDDRPPSGSRFTRLEGAGGDGGVECFWTTPDGDEWGYQAKFITDLDRAQIDDSVTTALRIHPRLTHYTVCLPFDLTGPTGRPGISQHERWGQWVAEWEAIAAKEGRTVAFELWTRSELIDRLTTSDTGGGRRRFWFDSTRLSPDWFDQHLREATADAGPRYHPELSVEVPITAVLDAFGETARFREATRVELRKFDKHLSRWRSRIEARTRESAASSDAAHEATAEDDQESAEDGTRLMRDALPPLDAVRGALQAAAADSISSVGDVRTLLNAARQVMGDARAALGAQLEARHGRGVLDNASFRQFEAEYMIRFPAEDYDLAGDIAGALSSVDSLLCGPGVEAAKVGVLFVTGAAGAGKTHAVCDAAIQRLRDDALPSVVVLGEKLGSGDFWEQVRSILGFPGTVGRDELLESLDAAGEAAGAPLMLFVDALNERDPRSAWKSELASIVAQTKRYRSIRLCLTCRTTYIDAILPDGFALPTFDHRGFTGVEFEAVFAFFAHFGLEPPTLPLLQPEYSNPLFLRMVCVGLTRPHDGGGGAILLFLDNVVEMLVETAEGMAADRLDIDPRSRLVHRAIDAVLDGMTGKGLHLSWSEADDRVNGLLPGRPRSHSLLDFLLREGLLTEVGTVHGDDQVRFGFERLGEYLFVAKTIHGLAPEDIAALLAPGGALDASVADDSSTHSQGLLEALAILVPERHGIELTDLDLDLPRQGLLGAVLGSLAWRRPETIPASMEDLIREGLTDPELMAIAMEELLSLSVRPGHPLGSKWFDGLMRPLDQPRRDQNMAGFLHLSWEGGLAAKRLSAWALRSDLGQVSRDTALDWAQTLLWLCLAPDRRIRDHATMAVVALMSNHPTALPELIGRMADVDDEYVVERLLLATYGVLIRVGAPDSVSATASAVWRWFFEGDTPLNALLRDHARSIVELAAVRGALPEAIDLARVVPPYRSHLPPGLQDETEPPRRSSRVRGRPSPGGQHTDEGALPPVGDDGIAWRNLRHSIDSDDFAVYTMTSVLDTRNRPTLNLDACKTWLLREIERMGFGGSGFDSYDGHMLYQYGGGRGKPDWAERLGKKYQWIALARLAGIVGDHVDVIPESHDDEVIVDPPALQADHLRDLDPTILLKHSQTTDARSWWSPVDVDFRPDLDDSAWLDALGFPDSSQLIEVRDPSDSSKWFVLQSYCRWDNRVVDDDYDRPWRQCWLHVRSYLVPERGSGRFWSWLAEQNFDGRWMPEGGQWVPYVYEGEYPWSSQARRAIQPLMTRDYRDERVPVQVSPSALDQSLEFEYDSFHDETIHLLLPSPVLVTPELGLRADGMGGYISSSGEPIFRTPSLVEPGPRALLVARSWIESFLHDHGLRLAWTVLSELQRPGGWSDSGRLGYATHSRAHRLYRNRLQSSAGITERKLPR